MVAHPLRRWSGEIPTAEAVMHLVHNARVTMLATALNTGGVGAIIQITVVIRLVGEIGSSMSIAGYAAGVAFGVVAGGLLDRRAAPQIIKVQVIAPSRQGLAEALRIEGGLDLPHAFAAPAYVAVLFDRCWKFRHASHVTGRVHSNSCASQPG